MSLENLSRKRKAFLLAGVTTGILLSSLASNIIGTAMPKIISSLAGFELYTWPITAYLLAMTVAMPLVGKLSDTFGFKRVYLFGIAVFLFGSTLCGFAPGMVAFIAFRAIQGIGAAVLMSNTLAIVNLLYVPAERAKYGSVVSLASGFASAIGPMLGGLLADTMNWRWVFFINLPIGVMAATIIALAFPSFAEKSGRRASRLDLGGAAVLVVALVPMLIAFTWGGSTYSWGSARIVAMLAFSAVALVVFGIVESKAEDPIIPLSLFRNSIYNVSAIEMFLFNAVLMAIIIFIPLFMQGAKGSSASESGAVITPMSVLIIAGVVVAGLLMAKTGRYKGLGSLGFILMCAGAIVLALAGRGTASVLIMAALVAMGLGIGVAMSIFNVTAQNASREGDMGVVTSSIQFFRMIGQTMASSVLGTVFGSSLAGRLHRLDTSGLPAVLAARLVKPETLSNAAALDTTKAGIPAGLTAAFDRVLEAARREFAMALREVFVICLVMCVACLVAVLAMKELPLRKKAETDGNAAG
jgi:EmrB/QacA subfamily drug resistance transporter